MIHRQDAQATSHPVLPFHWEIEFPEVFARENGGFDAFIGNPPYGGKNTVIEGNHESYLDWLKTLHEESHGNADLVAHFFRRAFNLLRCDGTFGLIATNTIRQGDTRHSGLRWICVNGGTIYAARRRYKWVGAAAVVVSVVWVAKGTMPAPFDLDGQLVPIITAYLFHDGGHENPEVLTANADKSFQGVKIYGQGFVFDDDDQSGETSSLSDMRALLTSDPRNADCIFPYIGGEEVNASPTHVHRRYVINFSDYPLSREKLKTTWLAADEEARRDMLRTGIVPSDYSGPVAADWPDLLAVVRSKVKPYRDGDNREIYRRLWWQYGEKRPGLNSAVRKSTTVLACCLHQPHWILGRVSARTVCSHALALIVLEGDGAFGLLQSRLHEIWARFLGSSLKDDLRYTPTDCFETFPFPAGWETDAALEAAGREYYEARAALMVSHHEGLTKTYNRFHDPAEDAPGIHRLRRLHAALDHAVLAAYGWSDLFEPAKSGTLGSIIGSPRTTCEFLPDYYDEPEQEGGAPLPRSIRHRWPDATRDEVLARLLKLNATRAAEERAEAATQGDAETRRKTTAKKTAKKKAAEIAPTQSEPIAPPQGDLFGKGADIPQ